MDSRIDKIFEPTRDEVVLTCAPAPTPISCCFGPQRVGPGVPDRQSFENPQTPPSFLHAAAQTPYRRAADGPVVEPGDRLLFFRFQCTNEMGDLVQNVLAVEPMGRYSNLVLTREGRIIDALEAGGF